jgi:basic amino acid/polyamine antiporter, APA family
MSEAPPAQAQTPDLRRQLSWLDAAAIFVGIILGSGIFVAPAGVAAAITSPGWAAGLWLVGACIAACGAFCYAECGARLPKTGGFYVFYREVYGPPVAFVAGWAALLVTYPASLAAISLIFARYLGQIIPGIATTNLGAASVGALALLVSALFNIVGVKFGANVQKALTALKVLALITLCVAAVFAPATPVEAVAKAPLDLFPKGFVGIVGAMVMLLWTFDGWSDVTLVAGELKNPSRDLGRAVMVGVVVLTVTYVMVQVATMTLLGSTDAAASKQVVADAVKIGLGESLGRVVALLVVVSTFGSINGIVLAASRLGFAMARDGAFFSWLGAVHPRFATPARSTAALIGATLVYVFVSASSVEAFWALVTFFSFNVWLFYGATGVALVLLRLRKVGEPLAWRAPLGWLPPAVLLVTAAGVTIGLLVQNARDSLVGLGVLLLAVPIYFVWRAFQKSA